MSLTSSCLSGGGFEMRIAREDFFIVTSRRDHDERYLRQPWSIRENRMLEAATRITRALLATTEIIF